MVFYTLLKTGKRILKIVVIKLIAPNKDDIPAKCKLKIAKSTAATWMSNNTT